jgi:hypothetical protein
MYPEGRVVYYEGDDPEGFRSEMLDEFGFDAAIPYDCGQVEGIRLRPTNWEGNRNFHIPAGLVRAVYGSERWPLGT